MSTSDKEEPMDICCSDPTASEQNLEPSQKGIKVALSIQWCKDSEPARRKYILQTALQTWVTKNKSASKDEPTCDLLDACEDTTEAVVSIDPPPDLSVLGALEGLVLDGKGGKPLTVTRVVCAGAQTPLDCVMKAPQPPPSQEQQRVNEEGCVGPPAAESTAGDEYYVHQAESFLDPSYAEEVSRIEKRNNCVLKAEIKVAVVKGEGDGNPQRALSELRAFVQSQLHRSVIGLGRPDPEGLMDALTGTDQPEEDSQIARSSLGQGPSRSKDTAEVFSGGAGSVDAPEASSSYQLASAETTGNVQFNIHDPVFSGGIIIDNSTWNLISTVYFERFMNLQSKFGVHFQMTLVGPGQVRVRGVKGRNVALENNAVRALFHLYKRIIASPVNTNQHGGTAGYTDLSDPPKYPADPPKYPADPPKYPADPMKKNPTVEAAAGVDVGKDECPICLEKLQEKQQLDCKHEFCRGCLLKSIDSMGPCCPLCKHVFGVMTGNQPDGEMTTEIIKKALSGFPGFETIVINYNIPDGRQTKEHPNPGERYRGTRRKAYLPNNKEGQEVLELLKKAFDQKLIFTIGQSRTYGTDNQVTWNDIHHKTSMTGGPERYGYPDHNYLKRVRNELKDKGIK